MATTAATGHSGALMAILLSRLAAVNPGDAYTGDTPAAAAAAAAGGLARDNSSVGLGVAQPGSATALIATDEVLRRPPADSAAREHGGGGGGGGSSWAWKARVDSLPVSSRLKRYDFVRELGSGSHGTLLLVRKRPLSAAASSGSGGTLGANSSHAGAGRRRSRGGTGGRGLTHGSIGSSGGTCSFQPGGNLRVLKESHFLPEAVNEARLLLLAGGGGGRGGGTACATGSGFGYERQMAGGGGGAGGPEIYGGSVDTGDDIVATATAVRDGGAIEGHQRGEVVKLHDFFVETVGDRSLAFLELEYCEGGDLASLILGSRAGGGSTAGTENSAATATPTAAAAPAGGGALRDFACRSRAQPLEGLATAAEREEGTGGGGGNAGDFLSGGRRSLGADGTAAVAVAAVGQDARAPLSGLPAARIGRVALGLCEGLQRLHERGILHRDLKPANILLTKNGAVRVADLGVSTRLDPSRPLTENAAGTIPFMAPEVRKYLLGSKVAYSGKADVWAVGALVYAMAVGDPAPAELATEPRERLVAAIGLRTGSEALSLAAHRALDPDPSRRPSVHQMTSMLQSCCEREGWLSIRKHTPGSRGQGLVPRARL
ncbi:protein kinase [Ectocarpus siliculosus]|uniref:non-specific serine/threonine protein kinase n=1 Tax=Ectocarpus siliculosus TaxID=2880 RepID=D8LSH9_ECTSI|nr:protein kinase [Ectocarpus siliculosus]|eukprot:CBN77816.1 protein kinase [Ectocarpus siliculosus]